MTTAHNRKLWAQYVQISATLEEHLISYFNEIKIDIHLTLADLLHSLSS